MAPLPFELLVVPGAAAIVVLVAITSTRIYHGKWQRHPAGAGQVSFDSDLGHFSLDGEMLRVARSSTPERAIPMEDVVGIRFWYERRVADGSATRPASLVSRWLPWVNRLDWYQVALLTNTGLVPVFAVGQVFHDVRVATRPTTHALDTLHRIGWFDDVEGRAKAVVADLQREFSERGHPLQLA